MALAKNITDIKGISTSYHSIASFEYKNDKLVVRLKSYLDSTTRQKEKDSQDAEKNAQTYSDSIEVARQELDELMALRSQNTNPKKDDKFVSDIQAKTKEINDLELTPDRPSFADPVETSYRETEITIDYFEPLTIAGLYKRIVESDEFKGSEKV